MKFQKLIFSFIIFCTLLVVSVPHDVRAAAKKASIKKVLIKKKVTPKKVAVAKPSQPKYAASLLIASATELKLSPLESITLRLGFKNTGTASWKSREIVLLGTDGALFATSTWPTTSTPVRIADGSLTSGRLEFYDIVLTAPDAPGAYQLRTQLIADGQPVAGTTVTIPIEIVISGSNTEVSQQLLPEPRIRVSLGKVEGPTALRVSAGNYTIALLDGTPIGALSLGDKALFEYDHAGKMYLYTFSAVVTTSTQPFRLAAIDADARFVLPDKTEAATWNKSIIYNEYRGSFELRWSDKIPGIWMVNELPIELYLKGLIETGNAESAELHKSVYTAARTYAYIHLPDGKRYIDRIWDVHAVWDQYYKGYAAERVNPNGVKAVDETRGLLVTYENKPVVTPYFTRSNGMTRGWKAAWGGTDKPWLQPVIAVHDQGKKLWGHGVGMSTQDAKFRILKDNWTHEQVLTYYYTGVQLKRVYE
ncbi:MAG: hypothetical protein A2848_01845 [Candidatus Magasanikbacteria bacterium RIFCSPHIGHO2_01_FULL_50_8]|uniref:Sporulation stage II protein D amidase enhancer LytB N-terminal domain-containing protein n=1 Tax=Candidatus Magasanikbacteria bacterium RIFCSPHIGHO2_01_FULL_50_8 TaxID=1798674 RepID=A0A1F6LQK4_9BACT|nr:MAG: hypothetical protein A2848_01845 [Candidatus Magasanikbacteria bacterium RIFCSPHIGHO2_01_FULL_50_8]